MMDRTLKERIIGAAVLVLVVVLVVPVFLDGPPEDGEIISEQVPLPGQAGPEQKTVVLDRDRTEPVPANGGSEPAAEPPPKPVPQPVVQKSEPEPETQPAAPVEAPAGPGPDAPDAEPKPAPEDTILASQTGMWAVQLGSFGNRDNAERQAAELRSEGHAAFLSQVTTSAGVLHRVRIGPQKDRDAAEAVAAKLKAAGHDVKVLPHP